MNDFKVKTNILRQFRASGGGYISGEEISSSLGVSRAYLWKYIEKLREEGYVIDALPKVGYRLDASPDKVYGFELASVLDTEKLGRGEIHYHEKIDSTNRSAYRLGEEGAPEGDIVLAEEQTGGKGRLGREWVSPPGGGIYMSLILRPDAGTDEIPAIALVVALSVVRVVEEACSLTARIKWPNDIIVNDKKICGILTEIKAQPDRVDFMVLGVGINVNTPGKSLPEGASSLKDLAHEAFSRTEIARLFLKRFEEDYFIFKKEGFSSLREECRKRSLILGKRVRITEHHSTIEGMAEDIDPKGALIVKEDSGEVKRIFSGDVVLCRA